MQTFPRTSEFTRQHSRHLLLCLVIVVTGNVGSAWATCGDYLKHAVRVTHDSMPGDHDSDVGGPAPTKPVCSGPDCRRHDRVPASPIKTYSNSDQQDAALVSPVQIKEPGRFSFPEATTAPYASGIPNRIFRPPELQ